MASFALVRITSPWPLARDPTSIAKWSKNGELTGRMRNRHSREAAMGVGEVSQLWRQLIEAYDDKILRVISPDLQQFLAGLLSRARQ
jgi:hypothetical protein